MPIAVKCPGCKALFRLADDEAGKQVRCQACGQWFAGPTSTSAPAEISAPKPVDPAPIISMSLDDPVPVEVNDAPLAEAPPPDVVDAILVQAPLEAPAKERRKPPDSKPARPRRAADLPKHSTLTPAALAFLGFLLAGALIIACFVAAWAVLDLGNSKKAAVLPPQPHQVDFFKDKDKDKVKNAEWDNPGPRHVVFNVQGRYHRDENLRVEDPRDAELGHVKTYLIPMEKGLGYNIDMKSTEIDAHLSLFDPDGNLVAKDDDSGGDLNSRILVDPKTTGQYRLLATDVKKGSGAYTLDIARIVLPTNLAVHQPLRTMMRQEAGCAIVQADLGNGASTPNAFAWSPDGKAFFILDRLGLLRRIRYPEFVEDQHIAVGPAHIFQTGAGLLVSTLGSRELWVFDPVTMQLKRRLPRQGSASVLASPLLSYIYVSATFNKPEGGHAPGLMRHDLTRPQTLSFPFMKLLPSTHFLAITPDGRYLLGSNEDYHMARWRVQDRKIGHEEYGSRIFHPWKAPNPPLVISADGKLLLHPINHRVLPQDEIKPAPASEFGVAAYRVNDFKEPVLVLDTGIPYSAAAIDPKSGLICMHTKTKGFVLANSQGKIVRELAIDTIRPIERLAFHPEGGKLLAFFDATVMSIELPRDLP
jgi:predicted Zn finger-like uncharacterized protein